MSYLVAAVLFIASGQFSVGESPELMSLTPEEMVFASKLTEGNRKTFCFVFSAEEREASLDAAEEVTPDQSVEQILFSKGPHPTPVNK